MTATLILGVWITRQILFWTIGDGLVFGLLAMGIVLIYRSTRVINFAVGNMGLPGAVLFALLVINYNFPFWIALGVALLVGAGVGMVTEMVVVKRLFHRPRIVLLIATVAIADFWRAIVFLTFPEIETETGDLFPSAIGRSYEKVGGAFGGLGDLIGADDGILVKGADLQVLIVVPVIALLLGWLITRTTFGKAVTASADNPQLSRLAGVNPHVVSTVVWTIGGFIATLTMILLSSGRAPTGLENLGPFTLTNALAAAVIAGMRSFPKAMAGGILIAFFENVFRFNYSQEPGLSTLLVFLAVVIALFWQSRTDTDESPLSFATKVRPIPAEVRRVWWIRWMPRITVGVLLFLVVMTAWHHKSIFEWVGNNVGFWDNPPTRIKPSKFFLFTSVCAFAIITMSLTVITGWSGQVSLAQGAYAGIGALTAAALHRGIELDIGRGSVRLIDVQWSGIPVIPSIAIAVLFTALVAALTGIGALRVRGIMLAISTFAFALAAEKYLYARPFFSNGESSVRFESGYLFGWDLGDRRTYFYFSLGCLVLTALVVGRLRRSGVGRSIIAVRDNTDSAAAYTVSDVRMKLTAFAVAGGMAALGGAIFANAAEQIRYSSEHFQLADSLDALSMSVIGGLGSVLGPIIGAFWVRGLPTFFNDNALIGLLTSSLGFLLMLMYFPGGFVQIAYRVRDAAVDRAMRRIGEVDHASTTATPKALRRTRTAASDTHGADGHGVDGRHAGPAPAWWELALTIAAIVVKVLLIITALRVGVDNLWGDGTRSWFGFGDGAGSWFGVVMLATAASGVAALVVLVRIGRLSGATIGAHGTRLGYLLYLSAEPILPFVWPLAVHRWLRADLAAAQPPAPRSHRGLRTDDQGRDIMLATQGVTVRFGGNVAVDRVSIQVARDEIVGLTGTNGAGKSTLMNAIGGYVPADGRVELLGREIQHLTPSARSRMGLGRTFQAATLFPELTVRETVQVALEARHRSSFIRSSLFLDMAGEHRSRSEADELIDFLGLGRYADSFISDLSTGTRRIVELSGLLALDAEVLCLDEPTAGVAQRETEAFGPLLLEIRREMGASMIIIEHDMPLIMSVSDHVYCLEAGSVIAEGDPDTVRHDPLVVASYLGTDDRAIARSDS